ncbi:MAG: MBL fold metallo-hydrolase, partial [Chloroflexi bacterium]|nr:MBL fold metallo-hydrolase [Chloroflexota bacterium]
MQPAIHTICLSMPLHLGGVNCYLLRTGEGFVLIDSGNANQRQRLEEELLQAGCGAGDLRAILLTHGDFDHSGNAAYLRAKYGARIAMHAADAPMVEYGNLYASRKNTSRPIRAIVPLLFHFGRAERFRPDTSLEDGDDLAPYGLEARVVSIPGHSRGSIGILTAAGDFFCGDLLDNTRQP